MPPCFYDFFVVRVNTHIPQNKATKLKVGEVFRFVWPPKASVEGQGGSALKNCSLKCDHQMAEFYATFRLLQMKKKKVAALNPSFK